MQVETQQVEAIQLPAPKRSASEKPLQVQEFDCCTNEHYYCLVLADTHCSKQHCYSETNKPRLEQYCTRQPQMT